MKKSNKGIFLIAFLIALIGAVSLFLYMKNLEGPKVVEVKTTNIVIAKADIPARTLITDEMLQVVAVPEQGVIGTPFKTTEEIVGKYARESIYINQQIHPNSIVEAITDELSLKIQGNNRAMTINVNGSTGVNGLIKPGDFVDIILFLPQSGSEGLISRPDIAKLFLQNIEVLAVNQQLYRESSAKEDAETADSSSYYVTLSIPIMDVEMFALAKDIGSVELALRPIDGDFIYVTEGAIWQELLLNDNKEMKDMAPEYGIIGEATKPTIAGTYQYDQYIYYVVNYGDTLKSISLKFYGTEANVQLIQTVNRIDDVNMILTGTGIKIPVLKEGGATDGN